MRDYKTLDVWKMSIDITKEIYVVTKDFPSDERYGLISQIRRAAVSIASNIAEGCGRKTEKHFVSFLYNAMGSLKEVECQIFISKELGYLDEKSFGDLSGKLDLLGKKLINFIKYVEDKNE